MQQNQDSQHGNLQMLKGNTSACTAKGADCLWPSCCSAPPLFHHCWSAVPIDHWLRQSCAVPAVCWVTSGPSKSQSVGLILDNKPSSRQAHLLCKGRENRLCTQTPAAPSHLLKVPATRRSEANIFIPCVRRSWTLQTQRWQHVELPSEQGNDYFFREASSTYCVGFTGLKDNSHYVLITPHLSTDVTFSFTTRLYANKVSCGRNHYISIKNIILTRKDQLLTTKPQQWACTNPQLYNPSEKRHSCLLELLCMDYSVNGDSIIEELVHSGNTRLCSKLHCLSFGQITLILCASVTAHPGQWQTSPAF